MNWFTKVENAISGMWNTLVVDVLGKMPSNWIMATSELIAALNKIKTFASNPNAVTIASLFNAGGIASFALPEVVTAINDVLPELEIMQGCASVINGISDPIQKADALVQYLAQNINKMPANWQKTHWYSILTSILSKLLGISENQALTIVALQLEKTIG